MTDPLTFDILSPRFGLPLLFSGQAQKEVFVNEAHALTDALLHCAIEGELSVPPATPVEGENWIVGASPTGEWQDHENELACRQAGDWLFVVPQDGMRVLDRSTGQQLLYLGSWQSATAPADPTGGSTKDIQARAAIVELIGALRVAGIFPTS